MSGSVKKEHWSQRAKNGHREVAKFFAKYGEKTGLAGGTLLLMGGAATMLAGANSGSPGVALAAGTSSAAMILGGVLKIGGASYAQEIARKYLGAGASVFDGETPNAAADGAKADPARPRGATAIKDPIFSDPTFQKAIANSFAQLENDPATRKEFHDMIQNSPTARKALLNAQKQIDDFNEKRASQAQDNPEMHQQTDEQEDSGPSMTYH